MINLEGKSGIVSEDEETNCAELLSKSTIKKSIPSILISLSLKNSGLYASLIPTKKGETLSIIL